MQHLFTLQYLFKNLNTVKTILPTLFFTFSFTISYGQLSHVVVKMYKGGEKIFPAEWLSDKIRAKATIPHTDRTFALNEMDKALGKYPKDFHSSLRNVFLVGNLFYQGQRSPGSHTDENIIIAIRHNYDIEKIFHREFLEILLKNYPENFNRVEWEKLSSPSKKNTYTNTRDNIVTAQELNPYLFEDGFLTKYSLTGWENDVAIYAELLFAGGRQFWQIVDRFPLVKQKALFVIKFYHSLNPIYTENWFRFISDFRLF